MKRVILYGKNKESIKSAVINSGFEIVDQEADFIISFGGDGTLIGSESDYPGIPKIVLKDSQICKKCSRLSNEDVLLRVRDGRYFLEETMKLEAEAKGKTILAMNDIIVHNDDPRHAIRYTLTIDDKPIGSEIIGDGIVVATPSFGSTGYYRSITDSFFEVGIGLAFNNSIEQSDHMVLDEKRTIKLSITRGPAIVYADNQDDSILLGESDLVTIKKTEDTAKVVIPRDLPQHSLSYFS